MTSPHDTPTGDAPPSLHVPLRRKPPPMPSPALRSRVLAAVGEVLDADARTPAAASSTTAWIAAASLLLVGLTLPPWLAAADTLQSPVGPVPASLSGRAREAGIADVLPAADASTGTLVSSAPGVDDVRSEPMHSYRLVFRRMLEGDL